jgi:alpha-amylase/alpha-mannosidase (GH57 family)
MEKYICIHGHFYQPPRENAWLEEVERQDSAHPYHDWNERISVECYRPNGASRILGLEGRVIGIKNNYSRISFNFGPTLLSWMEAKDPDAYEAVLLADRLSMERFSGHGSAIAQVYNHSIMPLNNRHDKVTQVEWGIADFRRRFGRRPEGMWLAETAVDLETLEVLADRGILFTILAPRQARRVRPLGEETWTEVDSGRVNPRLPYLCRLPSGNTIALFFYDGPLSHDMSFGGLLESGVDLAGRLLGAFPDNGEEAPLVHTATDGETFGHHHKQGEMALTYCLYHIEQEKLARITIYGEYLAEHPPAHEVEIHEDSSWSCAHGVERWRSDCGCRNRMDWSQAWRGPLREALDWLRDRLAPLYEEEVTRLGADPWPARDGYIRVILDRSPENVDRFIAGQAGRPLEGAERLDFLRLMEMQRHALLMYTSCGWFFDEISGIETTQVIQYAARAIQLAREVSGVDLEPEFIRRLSAAPSNLPGIGHGGRVYELYVRPARVDLMRVAAHYAISSLFMDYPNGTSIYAYTARSDPYDRFEAGRLRLALGRVAVVSRILGSEDRFDFAILHLGDHNLHAGLRPAIPAPRFARDADGGAGTSDLLPSGLRPALSPGGDLRHPPSGDADAPTRGRDEDGGEESYQVMHDEVKAAFLRSDIAATIRAIDGNFEEHIYSLWHLFRDQQREILHQILTPRLEAAQAALLQIYSDAYPLMLAMREMGIPLPRAYSAAGEVISSVKLTRLLAEDHPRPEDLRVLWDDIRRFSLPIDRPAVALAGGNRIKHMVEQIRENPEDTALIEQTAGLLEVMREMQLGLDLGKAQNIYYLLCRDLRGQKEEQPEWAAAFDRLGRELYIQCR